MWIIKRRINIEIKIEPIIGRIKSQYGERSIDFERSLI